MKDYLGKEIKVDNEIITFNEKTFIKGKVKKINHDSITLEVLTKGRSIEPYLKEVKKSPEHIIVIDGKKS